MNKPSLGIISSSPCMQCIVQPVCDVTTIVTTAVILLKIHLRSFLKIFRGIFLGFSHFRAFF